MPFARSIDLALGELRLRVAQLLAQRLLLLESRNGDIEDRLQPFRLHARDDIRRHARLERGLDRRVVAVFGEQHDGRGCSRVTNDTLLERVARRRLAVDDDDVGRDAATRSSSAAAERRHLDDVVAGGQQAFLERTDFLLGVVHQHDAEHPVGIFGWGDTAIHCKLRASTHLDGRFRGCQREYAAQSAGYEWLPRSGAC